MSRGVDGDHLYRSVSPPPPTGDTSRPPTSLDVGAARASIHLPVGGDGWADYGNALCQVCGQPIRRRRDGLWHHTGPER